MYKVSNHFQKAATSIESVISFGDLDFFLHRRVLSFKDNVESCGCAVGLTLVW